MMQTNPSLEVLSAYAEILAKASELSDLPKNYIATTRKYPDIIWRYAIFAFLRKRGFPFSAIGGVVKRDHSSIVHSVMRVDEAFEGRGGDPNVRKIYTQLKEAMSAPQETDKKFVTSQSRVRAWLVLGGIDEPTRNRLLQRIKDLYR